MSDSSSTLRPKAIPSTTPRVLTTNLIPSITQDLDASDVLECYALVRSVPLHGIADSSIHIQKAVLAFRFRPKRTAFGTLINKDPVEITLEYGPQRAGADLDHDGIPLVQADAFSMSWDNVGRVYYTTKIVSEAYLSSYYMASMTGTVLEKILLKAVEYAERKRRYQPFAVFSSETNEKVLKSSSSQDFTSFIWKQLAILGVEIEPILAPPVHEARLWATALHKIVPDGTVTHDATIFYHKLYSCLTAIATNDYTEFTPTQRPTISASPTALPIETTAPTATAPTTLDSNNSTHTEPVNVGPLEDDLVDKDADNDDGDDRRLRKLDQLEDNDDSIEYEDDVKDNDIKNEDDVKDNDVKNEDEGDSIIEESNQGDDFVQQDDDEEEEHDDSAALDPIESKSTSPSSAAFSSQSPTPLHTPEPTAHIDPDADAEEAQQAAEKAKKAAEEAKNAAQTDAENKAAEAANEAADAAQKAADATSKAAAQAAMTGILSGDGAMMSSIITNCFTNPQYGIASLEEDGNLTTQAYLYRDGSLYWHLELAPPYFTVDKVDRPLPRVADLSSDGEGGNMVDWTIAFIVLGMLLLGIVVILQQMGYKLFYRMYLLQRWFFNPSKYDYEGDLHDFGDETISFHFSDNGVPISLGGRRTTSSDTSRDGLLNGREELDADRDHSTSSSSDGVDDERMGDVELSQIPTHRSLSSSSKMRPTSPPYSNLSSPTFDDDSTYSKRIRKNPDLVDLPNLTSKSKVATPVGVRSPKEGENGLSHKSPTANDLLDQD